MRKIALMFVFSLLFYSCEQDNIIPKDDDVIPGDEYDIHGTGKIKTKYGE
jgi:hypothetical protein